MTEPAEVAVVVPRKDGKYLVVKRSETRDINPEVWEFPGGKIEGELPEEAGLRELEEETGLEGKLAGAGQKIADTVDGVELILHPYLVEIESSDISLSDEHTEYRWINQRDIADLETHDNLPNVLDAVEEVNGDVTVAVAKKDGKFLAMRRSSHESMSGKWEFPGGEVEEDETVEESAVREFEEESGLEAEIVETADPFIGEGATGFWRLHPVLVEPENGEVVLSREHDSFRWVERSELEKLETIGEFKALRKLGLKE